MPVMARACRVRWTRLQKFQGRTRCSYGNGALKSRKACSVCGEVTPSWPWAMSSSQSGFGVVDAEFAAEEVFPPAVVERLRPHVAWGDEVAEAVF